MALQPHSTARSRLVSTPVAKVEERVAPLHVEGEKSLLAASGARDQVMFTNKRIFAINVQGMTGSKVDISSLPYNKIQAFSIETAGTFDRDSELEMCFSGLGKSASSSVATSLSYVAQLIGWATLSPASRPRGDHEHRLDI